MGRIYLLRHGQASLLNDDYDRLSLLGEQQAHVLGEWLAPRMASPVLLASGTLKRHGETLRLLSEAAGWEGVPSNIDSNHDEYDHDDMLAQAFPELAVPGSLQARLRASPDSRKEFQILFERALKNWVRGDFTLKDGLSWLGFRDRNIRAMRRIASACGSGASAVVVTSGGAIAAICQSLLDVPDERVPLLHNAVFNASITSLLTRGEELTLSTFNAVSHLEQDPSRSLITYR